MKCQRVAILGGGMAGLTTAYQLTARPDLRRRFQIDVYQMGHRLGGKCASSRGADGRIEEHGLHVLFGFYHNFFQIMRQGYAELNRPAEHPLADWRQAFVPRDFGAAADYFDGRWHVWPFLFPGNSRTPGDGEALLPLADYLWMAMEFVAARVLGWESVASARRKLEVFRRDEKWRQLTSSSRSSLVSSAVGALRGRETHLALVLVQRLLDALEGSRPLGRTLLGPAKTLHRFIHRRLEARADTSVEAYRLWLGWDYMMAVLRGVVDDGVLLPGGLNRIDDEDYRAWLARHGAHPKTLQSSYAQLIYDAAFSYQDGAAETQRIAAGAALRSLMRLVTTYRGAVYYKMQAGMGEAVIAPLYEVLRRRGVRFHFFHQVDGLHLSADRSHIERVSITEQARLRAGLAAYEPLERVGAIDCWPRVPRYEQLENPNDLRDVDLESYYPVRPVGRPKELRAGRDFDRLVFAIPIGAVPYLCGELLDESERWRNMVEHVQSVQTMSAQFWWNKSSAELGWPYPKPLLSLYEPPLNTWSDMSQVLELEGWPSPAPRSVSYFTGPQPGPRRAPPPGPDNHAFERDQNAQAERAAQALLDQGLSSLLPKLNGGMVAKYVRSNCGPSDRCTIAVPGATRHRMAADDTGYENLVIAGDWIDNRFYTACVEGTVQSGILAARAVAGERFPIIGEELNEMRLSASSAAASPRVSSGSTGTTE